jgi:hypothetical protein
MSNGNTITGQLNLLPLDPDTAKAALVAYMQSQSVLKSYDFQGTVLNELLSILAVNTFKLNFYYNMINTESWMDSAQLRSSVISSAKDLNYLPRSATSSSTSISIMIPTDGTISVISIPIGTTFSGRIGTGSFNFSVDETSIYTSSNGTFNVANLEVYEGNYVTDSYIMDYSNPTQEFLINNANVDISSLTVTVTENNGATVTEYTYAPSLLGISSSSYSYFLQCNETELYEVLFGDNLFGVQPNDGALITLQYRVTVGDLANGVQNLVMNQDVTGGHLAGTPIVSVATPTDGGAPAETIDSIRFRAPRYYEAQERAVSEGDYEVLLQGQFPEILNVAAFGGETLSPPQWGSVLISVNIAYVSGLPTSKQDEYTAFLVPRSCMRILWTTPDTLYYGVTSTVNYDLTQTTLSENDLSTIITSAIASYNQTNLDDFKVTLRYSRFCAAMDASHPSIIGNETTLSVYKKIIPILGQSQNILVDLVVPIYKMIPPEPTTKPLGLDVAVWSSPFFYNGVTVRIEDDSAGNLRLLKYVTSGPNMSSAQETYAATVGSVNYATGQVSIVGLTLDSYFGDALYIYARPATLDIAVTGNNLLSMELSAVDLVVNGIQP